MKKIVLLVTSAVVAVMLTATLAMAHAGHSGITFRGGNGPDAFIGTKHNDKLHGGKGPDTLRGRAGNDLIDCGKSGNDTGYGGKGKDRQRGCETWTQ